MSIRRAEQKDIPRLSQLETLQPFSAQWGPVGWAQELGNKAADVWCFEEGDVQGFISSRGAAGMAEILNMAVDPACCRRGIGFALLSHALCALKTQGITDVTLEVNVRNEAALALYKKAGLTQRGRRKKFYHQNDDALIMGKIL